ncbi:hypothetical protein HUG10_21515 (plasmid) [Halorarum halophilum]|uniref:Uncharacterized protein n=1 Tax=Halorarum halophilum TaxID=2743090 RepID=A0A7D5H082_9EURY|nr:hypothetical protein [Halobaculum halophilum]QLG30169.1 hypothetical protein HUG10_21515 [Halobaculum halophilum]
MSRVAEVGDNLKFTADGAVGFDSEGYVLVPGDDGDRHVKKAAAGTGTTTAFMGVNHKSTYNYDGTQVLTGQPVGVIQDGVANVLAMGGVDYNQGDTLYFPTTGEDAGVASTSDNTNTEVGTVVEGHDDSGGSASDPVLLKVRVDGRV